MDFQVLSALEKAPSKKYVRKVLEYAYLIRNKLHSFQEFMETPVSSQVATDLELDERGYHRVICFFMIFSLFTHQLNSLANLSLLIGIRNKFSQYSPNPLIANQVNYSLRIQWLYLLVKQVQIQNTSVCDKITNREICQADSLIDIDWRVDVQIQTQNQQKLQSNQAVLFLQFETLNSQTNEKNNVTFQLNSNEVNNFHNNLKKIKDQLSQLVE